MRARFGSGECMHVPGVGHVFFIVIRSRPVSYRFTHIHTRQVRAPITPALALHAFRAKLGPRPSIQSSGHRSQAASQRSDHPYAAPWSTRRARRALLERARSLSRRALSPALSPPSRSSVSLVELALSLWRLPQLSFAAAADAGSGAAPIWHFFWWVAKFRLASAPLKTVPQRHAAPTAQQVLAWEPEQ